MEVKKDMAHNEFWTGNSSVALGAFQVLSPAFHEKGGMEEHQQLCKEQHCFWFHFSVIQNTLWTGSSLQYLFQVVENKLSYHEAVEEILREGRSPRIFWIFYLLMLIAQQTAWMIEWISKGKILSEFSKFQASNVLWLPI